MNAFAQKLKIALAGGFLLCGTGIASAFYDPSVSRWINRDPLGERGFEVWRRGSANANTDANLYLFAHNNGLGRIDPDGLRDPVFGAGRVCFDGSCVGEGVAYLTEDPPYSWETPVAGQCYDADGIVWQDANHNLVAWKIPDNCRMTVSFNPWPSACGYCFGIGFPRPTQWPQVPGPGGYPPAVGTPLPPAGRPGSPLAFLP